MTENKRKVFLIDPKFQWSFIGYTLALATLVILVCYAANMYFFWKFAQKGIEIGLTHDHVFFRFLAEQKNSMNIIFLITSSLVFTLLTIYGIYLSHRVAGPIYRFKQHFHKMILTNQISTVSFRDKDYFHDLAGAFNEWVHSANLHKSSDHKKVSGE